MYYSNYNPFYMQNRNYIYPRNVANKVSSINNEEKKDIEVQQSNDTISFQDFYSGNIQQPQNNIEDVEPEKQEKKNRFFSLDKNQINILGISLEIDDLIIIALIILLLLESDENFALILLLGLMLFNINLSDIFNFF